MVLWLIVVTGLLCSAETARAVDFFTKRVDQLTGWSGAGRINGQDSAVTLAEPRSKGPGVAFWFGDTWKDCQVIPNAMASTLDDDASDGISLSYVEDEQGNAAPPLPLDPTTGEVSVWLEAPFWRGDDVCAFYYMVPPNWPEEAAEDELGTGVACMQGSSPPFIRLGVNVLPDYPQLLGPKNVLPVGRNWLLLYVNEQVDGVPHTFIARTRVTSVEDFSSYRYWDGSSWNPDPASRAHVLANLSAPSVAWNPELGVWLATGSIVLSVDGFSSRFGMAMANGYLGPWGPVLPLYAESDGGYWGSVYNAFHTPFDQQSGRRFYTTATHWGRYNVDLFQTDIGHAESQLCLAGATDDAVQFAGESRPSTSGPGLRLDPGATSTVGLRLTGASWVQNAASSQAPFSAPVVQASTLVLPLAAAAAESFSATIRVAVGAPNSSGWGDQEDLFAMVPVAELVLDVPVSAGATEIRVGNEMSAIFDASIQQSEWKSGYDNVVPITLTRLDDHPIDLELASREDGGPGVQAWLCHGECPAAPAVLDGACRPAHQPTTRDCRYERRVSSGCGLGPETVLLIPLLGRLRRRRRSRAARG